MRIIGLICTYDNRPSRWWIQRPGSCWRRPSCTKGSRCGNFIPHCLVRCRWGSRPAGCTGFGAAGQLRDSPPGRSSSKDPRGRATQADARSAGCLVAAAAPDGKSLSLDLGAFGRTARPPRVATAPPSVGVHADTGTEHVASHRCESRFTAWPVPVEPGGQQAIASLPLTSHAAHRRTELQA